MQTAYFSGGCFWCVEAIFQRIEGIIKLTSGYCNGNTSNPTYQDICLGVTGHAEVVKIEFDEFKISFKALLDVFFEIHDPTTLNQQGNDCGTQYRSAIFYINNKQQFQAINMINLMSNNIVTQVTKLDCFYPAEDYHQNYFNNNLSKPYCQMLIKPKLDKYFSQ
ncbi:peptide-methionine (S)-S-oxide reductase MsrA [Candidatus Vesicomyidisocius sp. SY067_SCS001]|uniref:peptide-methionine (S)-S-oxide reductase MsrA n=1 Tax=Candidatus Vesicomyidisocius sp. SY067_SCS001 TaxID=2732590 RepID=UPI00168785E7|nr:peptide-methionine (S)-S-oxide reductase MsrA [Candidatus Vesicomyosocius sp. SY067_SCS001]